jgi:myo-inositol-1-phosphate synthase
MEGGGGTARAQGSRDVTSVNIGIVGVGNCACSLVQGLGFDEAADVHVVSALDIAPAKVGLDVSDAIWAAPNNALKFAEVAPLGVLKSRFGTTLIHRAILDALAAGGVEVLSTFQLNAAGNEDFRVLQDPAALATKQQTKTQGMAARSDIPSYVGATYVSHLADRKTAFIRIDALGFGATPIEIDVRMSLEDSPSAAPIILEAARVAKAALADGRGGVLEESNRLMKAAPPPSR